MDSRRSSHGPSRRRISTLEVMQNNTQNTPDQPTVPTPSERHARARRHRQDRPTRRRPPPGRRRARQGRVAIERRPLRLGGLQLLGSRTRRGPRRLRHVLPRPGDPGADEVVGRFIETALANDVRRLVLLSGRGEAGARRAEIRLQKSGADWTVVRCGFFSQNFSETFPEPIQHGSCRCRPATPSTRSSTPTTSPTSYGRAARRPPHRRAVRADRPAAAHRDARSPRRCPTRSGARSRSCR